MNQNNLPQVSLEVDTDVITRALDSALASFWEPEKLKAYTETVAELNKDLIVTEDNLKEMESRKKELSGTRTAIDNVRKKVKNVLKIPIDKFEEQVKVAIKDIETVEKPLADQIDIFEKERRAEKAEKIKEWVLAIADQHGLKPEYLAQVKIEDRYTNRTAKRIDVETDIRAQVVVLQEQQIAVERLERAKEEKRKMAETLCEAQSKAMGLITPVSITEIIDLDHIPLDELANHIVNLATIRKTTEDAAKNEVILTATFQNSEVAPENPIEPEVKAEPIVKEPCYPCTLTLSASQSQMIGLKQYLDTQKINYRLNAQEE